MIIVIADVDEVATLLDRSDESGGSEFILPQTSGPCVHCTCYGEGWVDRIDEMPSMELVTKINDIRGKFPESNLPGGERTITMSRPELREHLKRVAGTDAVACCTYSYTDGRCPHLDNPDVLCPVKDTCYAMHDVALLREACEQEQEEQDVDMATSEVPPETAEVTSEGAPLGPAPEQPAKAAPAKRRPHARRLTWTDEEDEAIRRASSAEEALKVYRQTGSSWRSDMAVKSRWYKVRGPAPAAASAEGDPPALATPNVSFAVGDRVEVIGGGWGRVDPVGEVTAVQAKVVSVQFPGEKTPRGIAITRLRRASE